MPLIFAIIFAILALLVSSMLDIAHGAEMPKVTAQVLLSNKFNAFGNGAELHDSRVMQASVVANFSNGLYLGYWQSWSLEGRQGLGNEIDYILGWSGKCGAYSLDLGVTYFDEPEIGTFGVGDILYTHASIGREIGLGFNATLLWENYLTYGNDPYEGGNLWSIGLARSTPLTKKLSLNAWSALVYDDGGFKFDTSIFLRGGASIEWQVTKNLTAIPIHVLYWAPLSHDRNDRRYTDAVVSTGFRVSF